ncbi:MAG: hypothetical protein PF904_00100, partial [Kiritimatiellae bacterium]|nr:hypothetical protein [Kiritimatiellia bacterium]
VGCWLLGVGCWVKSAWQLSLIVQLCFKRRSFSQQRFALHKNNSKFFLCVLCGLLWIIISVATSRRSASAAMAVKMTSCYSWKTKHSAVRPPLWWQ